MSIIKFKDGREFNIEEMKEYLLNENYCGYFTSLYHIEKEFGYIKQTVLKKVENTFGEKGIILLFIHGYDVKNNNFGIADYEDFMESLEVLDIKITFMDKINDFFFEFKYVLKDIFNFITRPIQEYFHRKKYLVSKHISYWFDSYFLKIVEK